MTSKRSNSIDYTTNCTVCIIYVDAGVENRLVYERPQMQLPNRPMTAAERKQMGQLPTDSALTTEARAVFSDMQMKSRIGASAALRTVFIARTAAAALEMNL
jgi:hypothetical protein